MSSISAIGSSSSNSVAAYQEYLARLQAQKQTSQTPQTVNKPAPQPQVSSGDVDHDGDSH